MKLLPHQGIPFHSIERTQKYNIAICDMFDVRFLRYKCFFWVFATEILQTLSCLLNYSSIFGVFMNILHSFKAAPTSHNHCLFHSTV